jgi:hypothetical protein
MTHPVSDPSIVWYGGMGHRLLSTDCGVQCYRCGMAADDSAVQEFIPDCEPDHGDHHWIGAPNGNECAYGDAFLGPDDDPMMGLGECVRS